MSVGARIEHGALGCIKAAFRPDEHGQFLAFKRVQRGQTLPRLCFFIVKNEGSVLRLIGQNICQICHFGYFRHGEDFALLGRLNRIGDQLFVFDRFAALRARGHHRH